MRGGRRNKVIAATIPGPAFGCAQPRPRSLGARQYRRLETPRHLRRGSDSALRAFGRQTGMFCHVRPGNRSLPRQSAFVS